MSYRDMAMDAGIHTDAGISLDEAAAWLEQQERAAYEQWMAEQEAEAQRLEEMRDFDGPSELPDKDYVCRCEDCGYYYPEGLAGIPATRRSYTCDKCEGYVMDAQETKEWEAEN